MDEVLVIGGAGFLGSSLVRLLRERGNAVRVFSRSAGKGRSPESGIRYIAGAVSDLEAVSQAVEGAQVVYDLAGSAVGDWDHMQRTYVDGARNVAQACLKFNVRRLIYTSTTATLDLGMSGVLDESAGTSRKAHLRPGYYHIAKIEAEKLLMDLHVKSGLPVVVLRPAVIVGRGGVLCHSGIGAWRDDTCCTQVGKGDNPIPFVLVQDVAEACVSAKDAPDVVGRSFNLAGDVRPTAREMVQHMRQRSGRHFRSYTQSLSKLYAIATVKHLLKVAVGKPSIGPSWHDLRCETLSAQLDCSAAKKYLKWRPVSDLETFLTEAIDPHLRPIHPEDIRITG